jgi:hypothetical protein
LLLAVLLEDYQGLPPFSAVASAAGDAAKTISPADADIAALNAKKEAKPPKKAKKAKKAPKKAEEKKDAAAPAAAPAAK